MIDRTTRTSAGVHLVAGFIENKTHLETKRFAYHPLKTHVLFLDSWQ